MSKNTIKISPGDLLVVGLPKLKPGKTVTCSVRVMDQPASDDAHFVGQIIDMVMFGASDKKYAPGEITEIPKSSVLSAIPAEVDGVRATITVEILNGSVVGLSRIDGKPDPINVLVVDKDRETEVIFAVSSFSAKPLANSGVDETQETLFHE